MTSWSRLLRQTRAGAVETTIHASGLLTGTAMVLAIALAVAATRHAHPAEVSPIAPEGPWRSVWVWSVAATLLFNGVGILLASSGFLRLRVALVVAVLVQIVPLTAPLLLSKDVYSYWANARVITAHGSNPYRVPPAHFPSDPSLAVAAPNWVQRAPIYGPAWEAAGTLPALAAGRSADHAQLGYRVFAVLGILASVGIVAAKTRRAAGVVMLGWSPLVALHFGGGGHNDAWMIAFLLLGLAVGSRALAGAAWVLSTAIKTVPGVLLPLELARTRFRATRAFWLGLLATTAVVVVGSIAVFGSSWVSPVLSATHGTPTSLSPVHFLTDWGLRYRYAFLVAALVFAAVYALLFRSAWITGRPRNSLGATALCLAVSQLRPWYGLWPTALAAVEESAVATTAAYALTVYLVVWDAIPL